MDKDSLGDRIKRYEAATTEQYFMQSLPLYIRIDGRAFHTFTRGLGKPYPTLQSSKTNHFDVTFMQVMQYVCRELVRELKADIGYVQSDEISLGWKDVKSAPFDGRKFKLESVVPALATGFFVRRILLGDIELKICDDADSDIFKIREKVSKSMPSFDCRAFQVPSLIELVNCFVWRENDAVKNSISAYALEIFSANELQKKSQMDRLDMLRKNGTPWEDLPLEVKRGTYFKRINHMNLTEDNTIYERTTVEPVFEHERLSKIENKVGYLFDGEDPILITVSNNEGDYRNG